MKIRSLILGGFFALTVASAPIYAHHSAAAYDLTKTITSTVVVTSMTWANPHCLLHFDMKDGSGAMTTWTVELYNPVYMTRAGWTRNSLKAGDEITISFHPARNGVPNGYVRAGDGKVVLRGQELSLVQQ